MAVMQRVRLVAFGGLAALSLSPWASPPLALGLGIALALLLGNPFLTTTRMLSKWLLQASVVGLGFGMSLAAVARAGASGVAYTIAGILVAVTLGLFLGRWLAIDRTTSFLITAGTSICGGSAIAAIGPAIGAPPEAMSVSLATVFVLNAVALYLFPATGHLLHLSQHQFGIWSAIAIHDTSSVVGAAASYGPQALQEATVLKLARALWIVPLTLAATAVTRHRSGSAAASSRPSLPWFIGLFLVAALVRTLAPVTALPLLDGLAHLARIALVFTLFLIGSGLTLATLRSVGYRPLAQGVLLWLAMGSLTLVAVSRWVTG